MVVDRLFGPLAGVDRREYLHCDHPAVAVSALSESREGGDHILRLFNVSGEQVEAEVQLGSRLAGAHRCDMNEAPGQPVSHGERVLPIELGPCEIATYRLKLAR